MLYLLLGLVFAIWMLYRLVDYRRRRLFYYSWCRLASWGFWPVWAFYAPVVAYALLLGLLYRGLRLFTLANPGMPHAMIAMVSKSDILKGFQMREYHGAAFTVISEKLLLDERLARTGRSMYLSDSF